MLRREDHHPGLDDLLEPAGKAEGGVVLGRGQVVDELDPLGLPAAVQLLEDPGMHLARGGRVLVDRADQLDGDAVDDRRRIRARQDVGVHPHDLLVALGEGCAEHKALLPGG